MKAAQMHRERNDAFVEIVIWAAPEPVAGSDHGYKYGLALVVGGRCVLRYDNERGKGDHRHLGDLETPYRFESLAKLLADFWKDVEAYLDEHRHLQRPLE